jgi:hypothetical protein
MPSVTSTVARSQPAAAATSPPAPPVTRPTNQLAANSAPPAREDSSDRGNPPPTAEQNDAKPSHDRSLLGQGVALPTNDDSTGWPKRVRVFDMPDWLPPFAAAAFAVLLLNVLLMVQRAREQSKSWPARFLRDLRHWDGRLPDDFDRRVRT